MNLELDIACRVRGNRVLPGRDTRRVLHLSAGPGLKISYSARSFRNEGCAVLITRGEDGMSLFHHGAATFHVPAAAREVFDVTGAGDTVVAFLPGDSTQLPFWTTVATVAGVPRQLAILLWHACSTKWRSWSARRRARDSRRVRISSGGAHLMLSMR